MDKCEIIQKIEQFAPPELAEPWDCSGWLVETTNNNIRKVMLALTVTNDIVRQAQELNCDMIIAHHPLFTVNINYQGIDIYCAHTNLDMTKGGTTDTLIDTLKLHPTYAEGFLRYVECNIELDELIGKLKNISPNMRYTNPKQKKSFEKLAFCAGSGSEFIEEAFLNRADALITGDLKFHTALESPIAVFDIGHFESEIHVLKVFKTLIGTNIEVIFANEKSPFYI